MKRMQRAWSLLLCRFMRAEQAAAAVEFALILPVMLTLYLGSIEASSLYTVDRRVTTISSTIGDLVSQSEDAISQSDLDDYFKAAEGILIPHSLNNLVQVVSLVEVKNNGSTEVVWSRNSGGSARAARSSYPLPSTAQMNKIARGGYIVVSETSYAYTPVFGAVIQGPINLYRESFYLPRFGECIDVGDACP